MATAQRLLRPRCRWPPFLSPQPPPPPLFAQIPRFHSTAAEPDASAPATTSHRRYPPPRPHEFSKPSEFVGSWSCTDDPRVAAARLDRLHRDYKKHMKQVRAECLYEMELLRIEKQRKDDARREALRLANEERKKVKAAAAETRAAERKAFEEEFRQTLLKERQQKLESWRAKEKLNEEKKAEKRELLRRQSSIWISDEKLMDRIADAIISPTPL